MAMLGGLAGIGSIVGAIGSVVSGIMAFSAAQQQAAIAEMNAKVANDNARRAIEVSQVQQQDQDMLTMAMLGEQEARQSASGLSVGGRSQLLARKSAAELGRRDALNVRQAGEIDAYNHKVQAANFIAEAGVQRTQGMGSLLGGFLGGASSIIGGARGMKRPAGIDPWRGMRVVR